MQTIGPDGGTLQIGEHSLVLPKGAVQGEVRFSGTLLVDKFLKVRITANGEDSYKFVAPATLKLSYGKCQPSDPRRLRVYKIDPKTNVVIEDLGGEVNPRERVVTASLKGLTTYTLGEPI